MTKQSGQGSTCSCWQASQSSCAACLQLYGRKVQKSSNWGFKKWISSVLFAQGCLPFPCLISYAKLQSMCAPRTSTWPSAWRGEGPPGTTCRHIRDGLQSPTVPPPPPPAGPPRCCKILKNVFRWMMMACKIQDGDATKVATIF